MASDPTNNAAGKPGMTVAAIVTLAKKQLDAAADVERQAQIADTDNGEVSQGSQTGATIELDHKGINEIPIEVINLIKDKVERLALSHNAQIILPIEIGQCQRLRYLNLRWNGIREFPETILQLSKLEILDLSRNRVTAIPENIKRLVSLKVFAISNNRIKRLPLALGDMPSLHRLRFDGNPLEFPTYEELKIPEERDIHGAAEADKERETCQQVKRVLKSKALRQRFLKPDDDVSESTVETPRPRKKILNGRFPVRPSMSGIDNLGDIIRSASNSPPDGAPIIPPRSHARDPSKTNLSGNKRPIIPPLFTGAVENNRSRSETVSTSTSMKSRRQGYVTGKPQNEVGQVDETHNIDLSSNASTIKPSHASTFKPAYASTITPSHTYQASIDSSRYGAFAVNGNTGSSSSPASPKVGVEQGINGSRRQIANPRNLSRIQPGPALHAARRLHFTLHQLHRPVLQMSIGIVQGTNNLKRSPLERHIFRASCLVKELDEHLSLLDGRNEDELRRRQACVNDTVVIAMAALEAYASLMEEIKEHLKKIGHTINPQHTRSLMMQLFSATFEARNVVQVLGVPMKAQVPKDTPRASRVSQAWSSRTVTPTQSNRSTITSKRQRGATILRKQVSNSTMRIAPRVKPGESQASSSTSMTFLRAATPRSETFGPAPSAVLPSRSNTLRSLHIPSSDEADDGNEQFDKIFLRLRATCDIATKTLPDCRREVVLHKDIAQRGQQRATHSWSIALRSCDKAIAANNSLNGRLKVVRLKDPGVRNQKDFWQLCDAFVQGWTEFATDIKDIGSMHIDIATIRNLMKPVQRAVKDVSKIICDSPLYHQALRQQTNGVGPSPAGLMPVFPPGLNTALAQAAAAQQSGASNPPSAGPNSAHSVTQVSFPATPLAAALGPAALATIPSGSTMTQPTTEYFQGVMPLAPNGSRATHERVDTVMTPASGHAASSSTFSQASTNTYGHSLASGYGRRG